MNQDNDFITNLRLIRKRSALPSLADSFTELRSIQDMAKVGRPDAQKANSNELEKILVENCKPLHLTTHSCDSFAEAAAQIIDIASNSRPEFTDNNAVVCHDHPVIHRLKLKSELAARRIPCTIVSGKMEDVQDITLNSSIGITVADYGVADCAAVVQLTQAGRPRSTSLVPSVHIAILQRQCLLANLEELYRRLSADRLPNSFVFISGPSKTADIEAHMVLGAHGPREMHIVLVD